MRPHWRTRSPMARAGRPAMTRRAGRRSRSRPRRPRCRSRWRSCVAWRHCALSRVASSAPMTKPAPPISLADLEPLARARMEPGAWDYYAGGSGDELTIADNREAWNRLRLLPRVLIDVSRVDLSTSAFGVPLAHPVVVAPTAAHYLAHPEAEVGTARGAAAADALMTLSTISSRPLEEVAAAAADAPRWFQLYAPVDRNATRALVLRAADAGYSAVAATVDL